VIVTIQVGIPGAGGDIGYGGESVWPTVLAVPLTRIDASTNKVVRQWVLRVRFALADGLQEGLAFANPHPPTLETMNLTHSLLIVSRR
jgi:hypothetical protein